MNHYAPYLLVRIKGETIVVSFTTPSLDVTTPDLRDRLYEVAGQAAGRTLALDFGKVDYLCSMALAAVLGLHRRMTEVEGRLVLTNLAPELHQLFQITRLDTLLDIRPRTEPSRPLENASA
jgi:anti-sigma B factor antagonist